MKTLRSPKLAFLPLLCGLAFSSAARAQDGWISMFNDQDLSGWKSNVDTEDQADNQSGASNGGQPVPESRAS